MSAMKTRTIVEYILISAIVLMLGSLVGWYFFLRAQTNTTVAQSAARGFGIPIPEGDANGANSSSFPSARAGTPSTQSNQRPVQLWHVEAKPTAGHSFVGSGKNLRLHYVDRAGGYVFEANPETGQVLRLTNTLLPKIYEALLSENGHVVLRSLDTAGGITTFIGTLSTTTDSSNASSSAAALSGSYLEKNILRISANPITGSLVYVVRGSSGGAVMSAEWNGEKQKTLLESAITSWRPLALADGRSAVIQAAADNVLGYGYELKQGSAPSPILGPIAGLMMRIRPPTEKSSSDAVLWSQSVRGELRLFARINQNATAVQLPVRTIADKCAWAPSGAFIAYCGVPQGSTGQNFLDNWYRGAVHSSDVLWRIDASAGTAEMVFTPPSNTPLDIEDISVDRAGDYIAFTNAADKSLWLFRVTK